MISQSFFDTLRRLNIPDYDKIKVREAEQAARSQKITLFRSASNHNNNNNTKIYKSTTTTPQPVNWSVVMDCGHKSIFSDAQIHSPAEKKYGGDLYYCDKCANGDRTGSGEHGFCVNSVIHKIEMATPLFASQYRQVQQTTQPQPQQETTTKP